MGSGPEHVLESASDTLTDGAGLAGDAAAFHLDFHIQAIAHIGDDQWSNDRVAVLVFGEKVFQVPAVDDDFARAVVQADAGDGSLAPAGAEIVLALGCSFG